MHMPNMNLIFYAIADTKVMQPYTHKFIKYQQFTKTLQKIIFWCRDVHDEYQCKMSLFSIKIIFQTAKQLSQPLTQSWFAAVSEFKLILS